MQPQHTLRDRLPMQIQLFGGVSAMNINGRTLDVGPAKCQAVLAVLALSPGSAVPVTRIVEMVWGGDAPRTAEKTLQSYVTRLRKGLGALSISRIGSAYRLDIEPAAIDASRFQHHISQGNTSEALAEWTGTPLAGLQAPGLTSVVDGLIEQWLAAIEVDLEQTVANDAAGAIGSLTQLTSEHPFREGLWALLMTALYRVDRQAEALAAYSRARDLLVEELGVEPGPRLRQLETSILGQDSALVPAGGPRVDSTTPSGTVTFGFTEVAGAPELWAQYRQTMSRAMARHDEILHDLAEQHNGFVFSVASDSVLTAFHRASDARSWAMDVQQSMQDEPWDESLDIGLRIGLHTGEPEERRSRYFGHAPNFTSRLTNVAHPKQTLISNTTAALLGPTDLCDLGSFRLDGSQTEVQLFQLGDTEHPALRTHNEQLGNLPQRTGRLFGRAAVVGMVSDALLTSPIVTLVGPGGIGKTRLAVAVGAQAAPTRPAGVWLVELADVGFSEDVTRTVANVLGVRDNTDKDLTDAIVTALGRRPILLILDNCEHVIEGASELANTIAQHCPEVRILTTSREGLGLPDERLLAISPLDPTSAAVELFNERASSALPSFDPDAEREHVEEICRRLDGVPLAIELAAARVRSLEPSELVDRLDDHLRLLTGGRRATVERHRTLRATIQWSYDLLTSEEKAAFCQLSIFAGPFPLDAAQQVIGAHGNEVGLNQPGVDDLIGALVDRSMVNVESGPFGRRFRMLETMRQFGAERLLLQNETTEVAAKHAQCYVAAVAKVGDLLSGLDEAEGVTRLNEMWPNLRAAFEWACTEGDAALAREFIRPIGTEISLRSRHELGDWLQRLLTVASPDHPDVVVFCYQWLGFRYMTAADPDGFEQLVDTYGRIDHPLVEFALALAHDEDEHTLEHGPAAAQLLRDSGDTFAAELVDVSSAIGPYLAIGDFASFDRLATPKVEQYRTEGPATLHNWVLFMQGLSASFQGNEALADELFNQSVTIPVPEGTMSLSKPIEARNELRDGHPRRAFSLLQNHFEELLESDNLVMCALAGIEYIKIMTDSDQVIEAARILGHLESQGAFGATAARVFLSGATTAIMDGHDEETQLALDYGATMTPRMTLIHMIDFLGHLLSAD